MGCKQNSENLGFFLLLRGKMKAGAIHRFQDSIFCQSSPLVPIIVAIMKRDECRMTLSLVDAFQDVN